MLQSNLTDSVFLCNFVCFKGSSVRAEPISRSEKLFNITTTHTYFTSNGERPFAWVRHSLRATHIRNTCVTHKKKSSSHPITQVSFLTFHLIIPIERSRGKMKEKKRKEESSQSQILETRA